MGNSSLLDLSISEAFHVVKQGIIKSNRKKKYFRKKTGKWSPIGKIYLWAETPFVRSNKHYLLKVCLWSISFQISIQLKNNAVKKTYNFLGLQNEMKSNNSILKMEKHFLAPQLWANEVLGEIHCMSSYSSMNHVQRNIFNQ